MKLFLLSAALLFLTETNAQTGIPVPEMTQSDNLINNFLTTYGIPGATVAIAKDGKIVYMRAFGYSDVAQTVPTEPYNLFRIASLSKQITSIAIMKLWQEGRISMSDKVFGTGGILENHPDFSTANITDSRIYNITVQNLLEHEAGWNRDNDCNPNPTYPYPYFLSGCDPISFPLRVTYLEGTTNPVHKDDLVKFLLEKGLDFDPGTAYNYSNIGYLILGDIIEKITGMSYGDYVQDSIFAPLGIYDIHLGKNLLANKQEREGEYVGNGYTTLSCYGDGTYVPWEYGGFSVEAMDAHGGWIASSRDMLKLLVAVDSFPTKPDILTPAAITLMTTPSANNQYYAKGWSVNPYYNWWHTGSLDGTASEQVRTSGGYCWIIICNKRNITDANFWTDLDNLGWNCLASTTSWPTWDLMASPTINASNISFSNVTSSSATVSWTNGNGDNRLLLVSPDAPVNGFPLDGTDYTANAAYGSGNVIGASNYVVYNGTGNSVTVTGLTSGKKYYFRVVEYNKNGVTGNNALYLLGENPEDSVSINGALPINLSYFKAIKLGDSKAELDWQTEQEVNSDHFEIEKSTDAKDFAAIGNIQAKGNTQTKSQYSFIDNAPANAVNYYRLKEFDKDGNLSYSKIVTLDFSVTRQDFRIITFEGKNYFIVSKNPGVDFNRAVIIMRDATGQILVKQPLTNEASQTIQIPALAKGIYFATVYDNGKSVTEKILIR
ncbi:MAG TPA: serine hydrolase [Chitinophagaceae bacterium]|nr:serine hydrolase [Chitinophagaceae bacterium]